MIKILVSVRNVAEALTAAAGGADVPFEQMECPGILGPRLFFRVWVGPRGGARPYDGYTLADAAEDAVRALTPGDPLPW